MYTAGGVCTQPGGYICTQLGIYKNTVGGIYVRSRGGVSYIQPGGTWINFPLRSEGSEAQGVPDLLGDRPSLGAGGFEAQGQAGPAGGFGPRDKPGLLGDSPGLRDAPPQGFTVRGYGKRLR